MTKLSQKDIVLNHLRKYGSISSLECVYKYQIIDLQRAIHLLRKKEGYNITDEWKKNKNESGHPYKVYTLVEEN